MAKFQNFDEIYSALYVDFDNMYVRLAEQDPALAHTFATCPQRWLRWVEGHALRMMYGDGIRRRILKRCCYLNPHRYHEFRPFFIRTAFQVVDCPPLTNYGKTSADIHLVMDCMDILNHPTRFDEVIILSGDADFTPLLLRIQEHARRTLVLSVGYTSPAYVAACSWRIREDWFISQALEEQDGEDGTRYQEAKPERNGDLRPENRPALLPEHNKAQYNADRQEQQPPRQSRNVSLNLPVFKRIRLVEAIKQVVAESSVPVPLPSVAQVLQREQEATQDWFGAGTLRDMVDVLDISPLELSHTGQGYVYDPDRHERPESAGVIDEFRQRRPELYEFAHKVHLLTDLPLLHPEHYAALLSLLAEEVSTQTFSRTESIRNIKDRCEDEGLPVSQNQISFVAEAVIRGGLAISRAAVAAKADAAAVNKAFFQRALDLCRLAQLPVSKREQRLLADWLAPDAVGDDAI